MAIIAKIIKWINSIRVKRQKKLMAYCHPTAEFSPNYVIVGTRYLTMQEYSLIQPGAKLILTGGKLVIGRWSSLSYNVTVITGNHIPTVGIPQHLGGKIHLNDIERDIIVDDDCWVCANATLLSGAKLGRGCVVGANALVNKAIPPYAIVAGIPCRVVAVKFTIEQIMQHEAAIYTEKERFSRKYLEELFETYYKGKKSIGVAHLSESQRTRYNEFYHSINI